MEIVRGETIYRNRNAVQANPATSDEQTAVPPSVSMGFDAFLGELPALLFRCHAHGIGV
jgi:hypothetical protein